VVVRFRELIWWLQDYAWAAMVWVSTLFAPPSPDHYATGSRSARTVVVLPGVYEDWRFMRPLIVPLHARGHAVHVVTDLGHTRAPIADGARIVLGLLEERDLRDVVIVAHSKGGLIGKLAMMSDTASRIDSMVAIGTPFRGSSLARLLPLRSVRPLVPLHPSLAGLADPGDINARITSVYGSFDEHVPEGSDLPGARNVQLDVPGHFRLLGRPSCLDEVLTVVESRESAGE
jgi:hypothetical protein